MTHSHLTALSLALTGLSVLFLGACGDEIVTCQENGTCPSGGAQGDGDSGGTGAGGTGSGGSGGTGSGGESDGSGGAQGGSTGDGDGDTGSGGDILDPCDACGGDEPVCVDGGCVACTPEEQGACSEEEVCTDDNECVACTTDEHCKDSSAPVCDTGSNECTGCTDSEDCAHLGDASEAVCEPTSGACVECTPRTEATSCGDNSCDPASFTCTTTPRGESDACEPCLADSECKTNFRCVPMEFKGTEREGGYCLKDSTAGGCGDNPYRSLTPNRVSLSGAEEAKYCTVNETLTTCEAVLDLEADKDCANPGDCGAPGLDDGLCETVTASVSNKCTYECSDIAECRASGRASSCAGDAEGPPVKYCGG